MKEQFNFRKTTIEVSKCIRKTVPMIKTIKFEINNDENNENPKIEMIKIDQRYYFREISEICNMLG